MESSVLFGISWLKSSLFLAESLLIPAAEVLSTGRLRRAPDLKLFWRVRASLRRLLREDAERIAQGIYPAKVLLEGEPGLVPWAHLKRLPLLFREAMGVSRRRNEKRTKKFSVKVDRRGLPEYYQRNFHFQNDGYLSEQSAELYDHQVELLFVGAGDAMRRLLLAPLKRHFGGSDGEGLRFLEIGCGTGSATRFLRLAFPRAEIHAIDLSKPYLAKAARRLPGVRFRPASGEKIPFLPREFDAVVSVFLFHELPPAARENVLRESRRVLKPKGLFCFVDSLQLGDDPALDEPLRMFPREFHEPFYASYVKNPMRDLIARCGFRVNLEETGFFSKVMAAVPATRPAKRKKKA